MSTAFVDACVVACSYTEAYTRRRSFWALHLGAAMKIPIFGAYCPHGDQCSKKHKLLGSYTSEREARQKIHHHLMTSTYHNMEDEEATQAADEADVPDWLDDDSNWNTTVHDRQRSRDRRSRDRDRDRARDHNVPRLEVRRQEMLTSKASSPASSASAAPHAEMPQPPVPAPPPFPPPAQATSADVQLQLALMQQQQQQAVVAAPPQASVSNDMLASWGRALSALVKSESSLRTAARLSRSAAQAFEEESSRLSLQIEYLTSLGIEPQEN